MKLFKKITAIMAAMAIFVTAAAVNTFAADESIKLYAASDAASIGESVTVKVYIDAGTAQIGAVTLNVFYDSSELEFQAPSEDKELIGEAIKDFTFEVNKEAGKICLSAMHLNKVDSCVCL